MIKKNFDITNIENIKIIENSKINEDIYSTENLIKAKEDSKIYKNNDKLNKITNKPNTIKPKNKKK